MPYQVTSGTTRKDLLTALKDFASTNGWTVEYDDITANGELALSQLNCNFAVSDGGVSAKTDVINGGTVDDGRLKAAISSSITTSNHHFYGHPDSLCTYDTDADTVYINDLTGPFSNIYLFTDSAVSSRYIHCVVQSSTSRYTHFSIGNLDNMGMSHDDIGYVAGEYYVWWNNNTDYSDNHIFGPNYFGCPYHGIGLFGDKTCAHLHIPSGVLDTAFGFPSGLQIIGGSNEPWLLKNFDREQAFSSASGCPLDHCNLVSNDSTTGGAPLWPLPSGYFGPGDGLACVLGVFPDICFVNMTGFYPGEVVTYGSDDWQIFPFKAFGQSEHANYGAIPEPDVNSEFYALAIKRIT